MPFLKSLNPTQLEAVTFGDGPLLILAGAGSGKTRVLTSRIAFLIAKMNVSPENILAVTFTNKAAGEMRERLERTIGGSARSVWLGTFHSLGLRLLRRESRAAGLASELTVYNDDDQLALIKEVLKELDLNEKVMPPKSVLARINQAKNENIGPTEYASHVNDFFSERIAKVYARYQKKLRGMGCLDFGDLICEPINLFRQNEPVLDKYRNRFRYILVDEYQDTNRAQYTLTGLLASGSRNLLAVGDPDQSIYGWRGADISNILDFEKDYPDSTVLRLEQNYRSTANILSAANSVIERNQRRMEKTLWTENREGHPLVHEEAKDEYDEARRVLSRLKSRMREDRAISYRDAAVFYRTNAQSRVFEELLIREGIPYTIVGGTRFYDRMEIRDALAYIRVIANPGDSISLQRIINRPARGVGKATLDRIISLADELGAPLLEAARAALGRGLLGKTRLRQFLDACDAFRSGLGKLPLNELALRLLEDSGYMAMWQDEGTDEASERLENIFELISAIKDFEAANPGATLPDFLDQVALISDIDSYEEKSDKLTLMTLHSAKGLEFRLVFLAGMEEGIFPHSRSIDDPEGLEEERRLCYVGMTRAKEELYLFSSASRSLYGETRYQARSRFLDEICPGRIRFLGGESRERKPVYTAPNEIYYSPEDFPSGPGNDAGGEALPWRVGMKVSHPSFGVGIIRERSGSGQDVKVTVNFSSSGVKKLAVKYAGLTPLS
ncbi:MAG: UvrD-helicase domain-containing protein [Thermodesulfobacteriota bacterium]|nr:MAG: UvrD-helicase domain-containing protein [Thermodesulfobacteriota bacterium]